MINAKVLAKAVQVLENPRRVPWRRAAGLLDKDIGCVRHLSMAVKVLKGFITQFKRSQMHLLDTCV